MWDKLRPLAATKRTFYHFQQEYEFCRNVYVDGQSFQWTSLQSSLHICHFRFHYDALADLFLSATDPVSRNRYTKSVIIEAFGAVSPGYFY
ncbi:hypothetical protein TNCV_4242681 [Trichonephila clavipes]|nr:hypothetical protein TNCV_4242681 [Trichonephila clavipes]